MPQITNDINLVADYLINNEIVAIPTETVYGLAALMNSSSAIQKVFEAKKRPLSNPLIVHVKDKTEVKKYVKYCPDKAQLLMDKFWPGPLTILFLKNDNVSELVTAGSPFVAIRVPNHPTTLQLLNQLNFPIVAPSANPFTRISPTTSQHVVNLFSNEFDYVLEGGKCSSGIESTIIGFEENIPIVYRLGAIGISEIEQLVGKVEHRTATERKVPGTFKKHYSPRTPCIISQNIEKEISIYKNKKIGILLFKEKEVDVSLNTIKITLAPNGTTKEALTTLYSSLHWLDQQNLELIILEELPNDEFGNVINDRLRRASTN